MIQTKSHILKAVAMSTTEYQTAKTTTDDAAVAATKRIAVIVDRDLYNAVSEVAREQHRSIKAQFTHIVSQFLKEYSNGHNT